MNFRTEAWLLLWLPSREWPRLVRGSCWVPDFETEPDSGDSVVHDEDRPLPRNAGQWPNYTWWSLYGEPWHERDLPHWGPHLPEDPAVIIERAARRQRRILRCPVRPGIMRYAPGRWGALAMCADASLTVERHGETAREAALRLLLATYGRNP